jgi:glycosyltransferase involved in cell wall biosynthesis
VSAPDAATGPPLPFSLLLPVYRGDRAAYLRRAFASAVLEQVRPPSEVVLVRDGPVPPDLEQCLAELTATSPVPVVLVPLPVNRGLAVALEEGLARCTHEVVARMDADDVSTPDRFALQLPVVEAGADVVGSALTEFTDDEHEVLAVRTPPLTAEAIARRAVLASPFNHPTVVYRRSAVRAAGGYRELPLLEDYWLFTRMIAAGARTANLAQPLVRYRVGAGAYRRRGGWRLFRSELALQRHLREEGFTTPLQAVRNTVVRGGYRLVPEAARRTAYRAAFTRRA